MNILILEDEERNANRLIRLLKETDLTSRIYGPLTSIEDTIAYFQSNTLPDLIIADIRLSDGLSFEALKEVPQSVPVIFVTAYDEYAIQAFKYNSFDYLLKPIDSTELSTAIEKVKRRVTQYSETNLRQLFETLKAENYKYRERFLLPFRDGYKTVYVRNINHIYTENKIVYLYMDDMSSEVVPICMEELEKQLNPNYFFRANRQFIININSIKSLSNYFGGKLKMRLSLYPEIEIIISKDKAPLLKKWIDR